MDADVPAIMVAGEVVLVIDKTMSCGFDENQYLNDNIVAVLRYSVRRDLVSRFGTVHQPAQG